MSEKSVNPFENTPAETVAAMKGIQLDELHMGIQNENDETIFGVAFFTGPNSQRYLDVLDQLKAEIEETPIDNVTIALKESP
ncbi:hypothetical protein [Magnetococcus sp. PR-3]|uniref:hypothetical protein n=1 Tax=Magnetococcus sp. PR-3 TaxID=3120355 RepID=UPI002FCE162F